MRARLLRPVASAALAAAVMIAGCSSSSPSFVDEGNEYDAATAVELLDEVDAGALTREPADEATALRHEYLVELRSEQEGASKAATLITRTFPAETAAVPFYVELATFDGEAAYIVIEALGRPDETLSDKRLWVIDEDGNVLLSGTR